MRSPRLGCMGRTLWWRPWAALVAVAFTMTDVSAEDLAYETIPSGEYASFLATWDEARTPVFRGLLRSPSDYAAVFHPAAVMSNRKPCGPPPEFFADSMLLVVARVIDAPAAGERPLAVESLTAEGDEIILRYRFAPPDAKATFTVKEVLALRIPRRSVTRVRCVENGQAVGDLRVAEGEWAEPQPHAD